MTTLFSWLARWRGLGRVAGAAVVAAGVSPVPAPGEDLVVMTYNLRFAAETPAATAWSARRPLMTACIERVGPDLIGTQEGVYHQVRDLAADLRDYEWIGLGREGGSRGEFMAVFYRRARFTPLEYDHFWLSDMPDVIGSATWGNRVRRMVTWVKFRDERSGATFYFWNTHFDHEVEEARQRSAALVRQRVEALNTNLPVILVGDFNAVAGASRAYEVLVGPSAFTDTWTAARERRNERFNTFNGFTTPRQEGQRIDWVLARGMGQVAATEIVTCGENGRFPSDHFPVVAWLSLPGAP